MTVSGKPLSQTRKFLQIVGDHQFVIPAQAGIRATNFQIIIAGWVSPGLPSKGTSK
jgi:hypothetical protein